MNARLKTRYDLKLVAPAASGEVQENVLVDNFAVAERPCQGGVIVDKTLTATEFAHVTEGVSANSGCACDACHKFFANAGDVVVVQTHGEFLAELRALERDVWLDYSPDRNDYYPYPDEREPEEIEGVTLNGVALSDDFSGDFDDRDDDWVFYAYEEYDGMTGTDSFTPPHTSKLIEKHRAKREASVDTRFKRLRGDEGEQQCSLEAAHAERERSVGIFGGYIPYTAENIARGKRLHPRTQRNQKPVKRIKRDTIRRARVLLIEHRIEIDYNVFMVVRSELVAVV